MARYRIVPFGETEWIVQGKWLLWWRDCGSFVGYETWRTRIFGLMYQTHQRVRGGVTPR
jgi:hypothetical protein